MWLNLEMVATAVLGHFFFKDYLTPRSLLAAGGIFLAAGILAVGDGIAVIQAGMLVALACACWAVDNHLTVLIDGITPAQSTFWKGLVAGFTNLVIGASLAPISAPFLSILSGLAVGTVSYGLSIVFYITAAQPTHFFKRPFLGVLLSIVSLREPFTPVQGLVAILFFISILVVFLEQHQHQHEHFDCYHKHLHCHDDGTHLHKHPGHPEDQRHCHHHSHEAMAHTHPHMPDLHHRHEPA